MVAVLVVIADHVIGWPHGGFVGVDVFFVLSGFLITGLLLREVEKTGRISFSRFYERRAKRILPAAITVLFFSAVFSAALLGGGEARRVAGDVVFSALFVGNWRFAHQGVDYFQQGTPPSPVQHFWSLGVEEQFYLVWPWVMLLIVVLAARWTSWAFPRVRRAAAIAIVAIIVCSFAWALVETRQNPEFAYFSTLSRAWELGLGALLAFLPRVALARPLRRLLAWGGLAGIAVSVLAISAESPLWPAPLALLPVVSTCLVVLAGTGDDLDGYRAPWILTNRVSTWIGDVSYSLYLWHFPVAILLLAVLPQGSKRYIAAALLLTLVLSAASYRWIEDPARHAAWFRRREGRIVGPSRAWIPTTAAIALIAVAGGAAYAGASATRAPVADVPDVRVVEPDAEPDADISPDECWGAAWSAHREACAGVVPDALAPAAEETPDDTAGAFDCYTLADEPMRECREGDESEDALRVALVGDSHAASLLPALRPQLASLGWSLDVFTGRGCRLIDQAGARTDCDVARPDITTRLESGDYDLVIATATRADDADPARSVGPIQRIREAGTEVVVIADNPLASEEAVACATRVGVSPDDPCATPWETARGHGDAVAEAAEEVGAPVVDLTDLYCADGSCPAIIGGVRVYRDAAGHITATWARTLSPFLVEGILDAAPAR